MLIDFSISLVIVLLFTLIGVYAERKFAAWVQDRVGPNRVGKKGMLQTLADLLKLLQKEDIMPDRADRFLFRLGPKLIFLSMFCAFAMLPFYPFHGASASDASLIYLLGIISLDVIGIMAAGFGSANVYSRMGAVRSATQILSYEVPLGVIILCVIIHSGTLSLYEIAVMQGPLQAYSSYFWGIPLEFLELGHGGGLLYWNLFANPFMLPLFLMFLVCGLAQANRAPFDLPESESELVAGFHTEYSGFRWSLMMLAEYGMMLLMSVLGAVLFLGGWHSPFGWEGLQPNGVWMGLFWLGSKTLLLVLLQFWIRWTYPRFRFDQLLFFCWKQLTPWSLLLLLLCAGWRLLAL